MTDLFNRRRLERREVIELLDNMYRAQTRFTAIRMDDQYAPVRSSEEKVFQDVVLDSPVNAGTGYTLFAYAPPGCPDEEDIPLADLAVCRDVLKARSTRYSNRVPNKIYRGSVTLRFRVPGGCQQWLLLIYK